MYAIEKDVPIPKSTWGATSRFPVDEMEVGDCFFVPREERNAVASLIHKRKADGPKAFTMRTDSDTGRVGCWRVK